MDAYQSTGQQPYQQLKEQFAQQERRKTLPSKPGKRARGLLDPEAEPTQPKMRDAGMTNVQNYILAHTSEVQGETDDEQMLWGPDARLQRVGSITSPDALKHVQ